MKTTGLIRRVDDIGRIVIPKEIRQALHVDVGDPMELFLEDGCICFRPYSVVDEVLSSRAIEALLKDFNIPCAVFNTNTLCFSNGIECKSNEVPEEWGDHPRMFRLDDNFKVWPIRMQNEVKGYILYRDTAGENDMPIRLLINFIKLVRRQDL